MAAESTMIKICRSCILPALIPDRPALCDAPRGYLCFGGGPFALPVKRMATQSVEGGFTFLSASALSTSQTTLVFAASRDGASPDLTVFSSSRTVHFHEFGPTP